MNISQAYGYKIGDVVETIIDTKREHGEIVPSGTRLRIVAISPKMCMLNFVNAYHDQREYFANLVPEDQKDDYYNRIRENFCTFKHL